jgi:hypothetical protein
MASLCSSADSQRQRQRSTAVDLHWVPGQQWSVDADGTIRAFGKCLDIHGNGTATRIRSNFEIAMEQADSNGVSRPTDRYSNPQSGRCLMILPRTPARQSNPSRYIWRSDPSAFQA